VTWHYTEQYDLAARWHRCRAPDRALGLVRLCDAWLLLNISWTLCRHLPCGAHANAAATLMRLGKQNPGVCEAIRQSGGFISMADMLICKEGPCRSFCCSHKQWLLHVSTCNL
jgi:hypothetical protein